MSDIHALSISAFDAYQEAAGMTAVYPGSGTPVGLAYAALHLAGEAGECTEQVAKAIRDDGFMTTAPALTAERKEAITKEIGDVLWYVAAVCSEIGVSMADVADQNIRKLKDRAARSVINGSGDNR